MAARWSTAVSRALLTALLWSSASLCLSPASARAQYWAGRLPTVRYVEKTTNHGKDPRDGAARQAAAYTVLRDFIETGAGMHAADAARVPQQIAARYRDYAAAAERAVARAKLSPADVQIYVDDFVFRQGVVSEYFAPSDRASYLRQQLQKRSVGTAAGSPAEPTTVDPALAREQLGAVYARLNPDARRMLERGAWIVGVPLALLALIGGLTLLRELTGSFGLRGMASPQLRAGWGAYPIRTFTGVLADSQRGSAFLRNSEGRERPLPAVRVQTTEARAGHVLSVAWAERGSRAVGGDLLVRNHTTDRVTFNDNALRTLLRARAGLHALLIVAALAFLGWALLGPLAYMLSVRSLNVQQLTTPAVIGGLAALAAAPFAAAIVRAVLARTRVATCKRELRQRVLPLLDDAADELQRAA